MNFREVAVLVRLLKMWIKFIVKISIIVKIKLQTQIIIQLEDQ